MQTPGHTFVATLWVTNASSVEPNTKLVTVTVFVRNISVQCRHLMNQSKIRMVCNLLKEPRVSSRDIFDLLPWAYKQANSCCYNSNLIHKSGYSLTRPCLFKVDRSTSQWLLAESLPLAANHLSPPHSSIECRKIFPSLTRGPDISVNTPTLKKTVTRQPDQHNFKALH